jgi:hypothetical protein
LCSTSSFAQSPQFGATACFHPLSLYAMGLLSHFDFDHDDSLLRPFYYNHHDTNISLVGHARFNSGDDDVRFAQGFPAMLPLWTGAIPVGIAYGAAAREAGLSLAETQLMSLTVFSAAAQMSAVALIGAGRAR